MRIIVSRFIQTLLWLLISCLVLLALMITALRVALPHMNRYQAPIVQWINQQSEIQLSFSDIQGLWQNTHPSLSFRGLKAHLPDDSNISLDADSVDIEFDLFKSIIQRQPVVANLVIHNLHLDMSSVNILDLYPSSGNTKLTPHQDSQRETIRQLDNIFLRQLDDFSILNSTINYRSISGDIRQLNINRLKWRNEGHQHQAQGIVSVADTGINSLSVSANFEDFDSFKDVSGQFYVGSDNIEVGSWITQYLKKETGIKGGQLSFNAWLTLKHNAPVDGYVQLKPSTLIWSDQGEHTLRLDEGVFKLVPNQSKGVTVRAQSIRITQDKHTWPMLNFLLDWSPENWRMNVKELDIGALVPVIRRFPLPKQAQKLMSQLNPQGKLQDIRVEMSHDDIRYSAQLSDGAISQWYLLPEVHHLQASISGNRHKAVIRADLVDDQLPYGDVFQAPLNINQGHVNLVWQSTSNGWSLWSDKVAVSTPDLHTIGAFKLDFAQNQSPFLSFYAEADLSNAGETWRYLPTRALGDNLTDYLSSAIQGGQIKTAKLLWYGPLNAFPYHHHEGIFQASVGLKKARFSYNTAWPPLTNLQLHLLFQNDAMYLDSHHAELMKVKAQRITGRIPHLESSGHIDIEAVSEAQGNDVRDFMTSTPLVDSVGAALTTVQVSGNVKSEFQLKIPFDSREEARAWGWADLKNNRVEVQSPDINLKSVSGRIHFDNDVLTASGINGVLLGQKVALNFNGESSKKGYNVSIKTAGDWKVRPLAQYVGNQWIQPLSGDAPWNMDVDLQLNDIGFSYQIDLAADLKRIASQYPYPLNKRLQEKGKAILQASGNQETISARVQVPQGKYQAEIDITKPVPVLSATYWVLGKGSFKVSPIVGHSALIRTDHINLDQWIQMHSTDPSQSKEKESLASSRSNMPVIPKPEHVDMQVKDLTLATLEWHDVAFVARRKNVGWRIDLKSQEAQGEATYIEPYDLSVSLSQLHLYIPKLEQRSNDKSLFIDETRNNLAAVTDFDRRFHELMPNLTLVINDFWFQGYKVGHLNMDFQRQGDVLLWKNIDITSGTNKIHINGDWLLKGDQSHTKLKIHFKGKNNSDLMARFGITSGIQNASFVINSQVEWEGAPWSMQLDTLQGTIDSKLGKGSVSDVSGAARLLGMFSLDSIIRKMKLDFSDVFDKGMAFDSIEGKGTISQGVFVTNDIKMDAVAGDMQIKGIVNLNSNVIDAEVHFVPDITSGIPVLSAFAVTPQTALYVLAITTVISPVVEVFTEVDYSVKGPIDNPTVKEISRSKGEFKLPDEFRKEAKKLGIKP